MNPQYPKLSSLPPKPFLNTTCSTSLHMDASAPLTIKLDCTKAHMHEGGGGGGAGLSLNTLSPDKINYNDVSICQRVPVAQSGHWDLPPNSKNREQMAGLKEKGMEKRETKRQQWRRHKESRNDRGEGQMELRREQWWWAWQRTQVELLYEEIVEGVMKCMKKTVRWRNKRGWMGKRENVDL